MSSHRISAPSKALTDSIMDATQMLTIDQIRQALPEAERNLLAGDVAFEMEMERPMTSGNRAALYVLLKVTTLEGNDTGTRNDTPLLVSWTFHNADILSIRPDDLRLDLDRIVPVRD